MKLAEYIEQENINNNEIIDSINTAWNGDDSLKYINTMKEKCLNGLKELNDCVDDYGIYLKKIPDVYGALDEAFSSKKIDV